MLLTVDIGNSSINIGLFTGKRLLKKAKIPSYPIRTEEEYAEEITVFSSATQVDAAGKPLDAAIISSVVPEITDILYRSMVRLSKEIPLILNSSINTGIVFDVLQPLEIGADRIANVAAAQEIAGPSAIVVDFGTATTISVIKNGVFTGGSIMPGIDLMSKSLHGGTSKLPLVDIPELVTEGLNLHAIGKDTTICIISGIIYGTAGGVERLISEMEEAEGPFRLLITGGNAGLIKRFLKKDYTFEPDLTLHGLRLIHERNTYA